MMFNFSVAARIYGAVIVFVILWQRSISTTDIPAPSSTSGECSPDKLIVYKLVLHTFWTSIRFPKHYPQWRPPAQWSILLGRSHGKSYVLFRAGEKSSIGVKAFVESGKDDELNGVGQGEDDVFDAFTAPAIPTGSGRTETQFVVEGNHSLVSLITRIVPSPDWFIGLDSFDLCVNGNWLDSITVEADPMDAGTDNGFTFTAPNWPTQPQGVIFRMSSKYPSHPAGSFYYPQLKRLPPIATFQFIKIRAYDLSEVFYRTEDERNYEVFKISERRNEYESDAASSNEVDQEMDGQRLEQEIRLRNELFNNDTQELLRSVVTAKSEDATTKNTIKFQDFMFNDFQTRRHDSFKKKKKKYSRDCKITDWGEWSSCSASCGVGEMRRKRKILKYPKGKGQSCPPLVETKWCKSDASCTDNLLFKW